MARCTVFLLALFGLVPAPVLLAQPADSQPAPSVAASALTVAAGTRVTLAMVRPVWTDKVKTGDPLYMEVVFPVTAGDRVALPAGTYVTGSVNSIVLPTRKTLRATIEARFTQIIFANGYTVPLPPTVSQVMVQVGQDSPILLDNGSQVKMTLAAPLVLDAARVMQAMAVSNGPSQMQFKPAALCIPTAGTPGSPGTPDTVIPGTPGTPDTTVPGGPGMPDITIPGTPSTPATVIPGTPGTEGTPGTYCPLPPLVLSSEPPGTAVALPGKPEKTRLQNQKKG